ncbi:hypothetical protein ACFQ0O_09725 [Saccharopolyspora spinosporotrichia]
MTADGRSLSMALPADAVAARDRVHCDLGRGWAEGSTVDRKGQVGDPAAVPDYRAASARAPEFPWLPVGVAALVGLLVGAGVMLLFRRKA